MKRLFPLLTFIVLLNGCTHTGRTSSDSTIRPVIAAEATAPAISDAERTNRVYEYWQATNTGLVDRPLSVSSARDVTAARRQIIIDRDGGKCTLCGSTIRLHVDHRVALENGGDNTSDNLAALCRDCYREKSKLDNSLRREREKIKPDPLDRSTVPP